MANHEGLRRVDSRKLDETGTERVEGICTILLFSRAQNIPKLQIEFTTQSRRMARERDKFRAIIYNANFHCLRERIAHLLTNNAHVTGIRGQPPVQDEGRMGRYRRGKEYSMDVRRRPVLFNYRYYDNR